jgi:hypothetical protein
MTCKMMILLTTLGAMMKKLNLIVTCVAVAGLVACGGGGGGGASSASTVGLGGVASKGLLSSATVEAFEVSGGNLISLGASTTTDAKGAYSLTGLRSTTNPVIVKVTVTTSTNMLDETGVLVNGDFPISAVKIQPGTVIRSVLPSLAATSEVVVSPYTELAVAAAASTGTLNAETLASAQDTVTQLIGIDPFKTKPINASEMSTATADQQKMMLLLTSVAQDAKSAIGTTGCTDPSGVACALKALNDKGAMEKDSSTGKYQVKNSANLKTAVDTSVTNVKTKIANGDIAGSFATSINSQTIATTAPVAVDPVVAVQTKSLDAFLASIRTGFNSALDIIKSRSSAADGRINQLVMDSVDTGFGTVGSVIDNCKINSSNQFICTNSSLNNGPKFTGSAGSYTFTYSSADAAYTFQGDITASYTAAGAASLNINNKRKKGTTVVEDVELSVSGSGLTDTSNAASVTINKLVAKKYDTTNASSKYATVTLTGLTLSGNKTTKKINISAPVSVVTSDGDGFSGTINNLELQDVKINQYNSDSFGSKLDLSLKITAKEGNLVSLNLTAERDVKSYDVTGFHPWLEMSSTNVPTESINMLFTLADDSTIGLTKVQNKYNVSSMTATAKTGSASIVVSGVFDVDKWGTQTINSDGFSITSSGVFSAKVKKDSHGEFQGTLYEGTKQIGVITDGVIYVGTSSSTGKQVSLK